MEKSAFHFMLQVSEANLTVTCGASIFVYEHCVTIQTKGLQHISLLLSCVLNCLLIMLYKLKVLTFESVKAVHVTQM